ncbi:MAG: GspH/FimT family pseudopilin [Syntrophobacteraceae bacterium]
MTQPGKCRWIPRGWKVMVGLKKNMGTGRNERGFSLIELMVVVGLMVLFGMMTVRFNTRSWMDSYKLKGAARDLYATMQQARMGAIKTNTPWAVRFDTSGTGTYQLESFNGAWNSEGPTVNLSNYDGGPISYGFGSATIDVDGNPLPAAPVTFVDGSSAPVSAPQYRVTFSALGFSNSGCCYLSSTGGVYAVGTSPAGTVKIRKWDVSAFK